MASDCILLLYFVNNSYLCVVKRMWHRQLSQLQLVACMNSPEASAPSATYNGQTSDKCPATCALCPPSCVGQADKWPDELYAPVNARYI